MDILPLPKKFFNQAKELFITKIELSFQGGNDEGYLKVNWAVSDDYPISVDEDALWNKHDQLMGEIQEWADDAYEYSGAGDGTSYGDYIIYDLVELKAYHTGWWHALTKSKEIEVELATDDEE